MKDVGSELELAPTTARNDESRVRLRVIERPVTRGDCADVPRPCPFVICKHHLFFEVKGVKKAAAIGSPHMEPTDMDPNWSCGLDVADRGAASLEDIADTFGVVREAVRLTEANVLSRLQRGPGKLREYHDGPIVPKAHRIGSAGRVAIPSQRDASSDVDPDYENELNDLLEGERRDDDELISDLLYATGPDGDERFATALWEIYSRRSGAKSKWSVQASSALRKRAGEKP